MNNSTEIERPSLVVSPNSEQESIMDAVTSSGRNVIAINALAGTGKTTTLTLLAQGPLADTSIQYITFNSRAAADGKRRFGANTIASTAHSHAWRSRYPGSSKSMAQVFGDRLVQGGLFGELAQVGASDDRLRRSFTKVAKALHLEKSGWRGGISPLLQVIDGFTKSSEIRITNANIPSAVRTLALRTNSLDHLEVLVAEAQKLWDRQIDATSTLPIPHSLYLKLASLTPGPMCAEVVFFDEAQDASAPMLQILDAHVAGGGRLVMVGDKHQHIYGWAGALNAIDAIAEKYAASSLVLPLCQSYRFGQDIADAGNTFLDAMGATYRLVGLGPKGESVAQSKTNVILFRSNLKLIMEILASNKRAPDKKFHVVGGTKETVMVLNDLSSLYSGQIPKTGDLAGFADWEELKEFTETPLGSTYLPLVNLVERLRGSVGGVAAGLRRCEANAADADVILSTTHKAKGGEWGSVKLSEEFQSVWDVAVIVDPQTKKESYVLPEGEELALQYVAATRAKRLLVHRGLLPKATEHLRMVRQGSL